MPRRKLSEYRSKSILSSTLNLPYVGWSLLDNGLDLIAGYEKYVVKVDQAVKGRFKKGLVLLNVSQQDLQPAVDKLKSYGYDSILVEPHIEHDTGAERYMSLSITRDGYSLSYSKKGGVDVENNTESIKHVHIDSEFNSVAVAEDMGITVEQLDAIIQLVKSHHFSFFEINPYVVDEKGLKILDCAIEVDDAGAYSVGSWKEEDLRHPRTEKITVEEEKVRMLDRNSPASFNLSVLNPNGSIFLLLSGGGASVVIADEIYNVGLGEQLANYGEYSGNPNADEAYLYTQQVLSLIDSSTAPKKILFIGGAAANFTDIADTFNGVIRALDESADVLRKNKVKVYVRRGGPRQEIGLAKIKDALEAHGLLGGVYDPSTSITDALTIALKGLKDD